MKKVYTFFFAMLVTGGCKERTYNDNTETAGTDQVTQAKPEQKQGWFWQVTNTGSIIVSCNVSQIMTLSAAEYEQRRNDGSICPSAPMSFIETSKSCEITSVPSASLAKIQASALTKCMTFGVSNCWFEKTSSKCVDAEFVDITSAAGIAIAATGLCVSVKGINRQHCEHTASVTGKTPSSNKKGAGSIPSAQDLNKK